MKVRVDNIIYQLAGSDDPLTADELGKKLAVSSRTIKSEMAEVRSELKKVGAELQAKRNEGYSLVIVCTACTPLFHNEQLLCAGWTGQIFVYYKETGVFFQICADRGLGG